MIEELKGQTKNRAIADRLHKNAEIITQHTQALDDIKTNKLRSMKTKRECFRT